MKTLFSLMLFCVIMVSCKTAKPIINPTNEENVSKNVQDTIKIVNEELAYEVIIIESGFDSWMLRRAKPKAFYTQSFLENKNIFYVAEWNSRVVSSNYNSAMYDMQINYSQGIDYGFDVNYTLYHYFVFFEEKYNQKLTGHNPRF